MNCHAGLASLCVHGDASPMYLDAVADKTFLCGPCIAAATRLGMNPRADRRAVVRIPLWRQRDLSRDETGRVFAA